MQVAQRAWHDLAHPPVTLDSHQLQANLLQALELHKFTLHNTACGDYIT